MRYREGNPKAKETIVYKMFGKQCKDLTPKERRLYVAERQKAHREKDGVMDKCREYSREYQRKRNINRKHHKDSFVWQTFGKSYNELTFIERSEYYRLRHEILGRNKRESAN